VLRDDQPAKSSVQGKLGAGGDAAVCRSCAGHDRCTNSEDTKPNGTAVRVTRFKSGRYCVLVSKVLEKWTRRLMVLLLAAALSSNQDRQCQFAFPLRIQPRPRLTSLKGASHQEKEGLTRDNADRLRCALCYRRWKPNDCSGRQDRMDGRSKGYRRPNQTVGNADGLGARAGEWGLALP